ncbi:MAG: flagellar basal body P-ring protein FlgI [Phycisphaerales bacterium JB038]
MATAPRTTPLLTPLCLAVSLALGVAGCEPPPPTPSTRSVAPVITRDIPRVLRGTIGSECSPLAANPLLVSAYGVVVGLRGTGSSDIPIPIRAELEREAALHGFGQVSSGLRVTPTQLLNDPNTAAVVVQGVVPPGAPAGHRFDLVVGAVNGTSTTSLEGGRLFTMELRPGAPTVGRAQRRAIAKGGGELFLNPFVEPGGREGTGYIQTTGRILNGGVVLESRPLQLVLDNPSHARVRAIVDAINRKFPRRYGQEETARGLDGESVELSVPREYHDNPAEFLQLVLHTRIDQRFPEEYARRYVESLIAQPELAVRISWCLQALGRTSLPALQDLYDFPEVRPRLVALRAGAQLEDPRVAPHLIDLAATGPQFLRDEAIALLGDLPGPDPNITQALQQLVDDDELAVRLAAYEALAKRRDWSIATETVGEKFRVDFIEAEKPLLYASLQETPRLVVFGDVEIKPSTLISTWSGRLILSAATPEEPVRIYYRPLGERSNPATFEAEPEVSGLIRMLGHKTTVEQPEPGFDLSYSETIGALYEIWRGGGLNAPFVAEQDRLTSELLAASDVYLPPARADSPRDTAPEPTAAEATAEASETEPVEPRGYVVPLQPRTDDPDKQ